jgi:hypothetical protein
MKQQPLLQRIFFRLGAQKYKNIHNRQGIQRCYIRVMIEMVSEKRNGVYAGV